MFDMFSRRRPGRQIEYVLTDQWVANVVGAGGTVSSTRRDLVRTTIRDLRNHGDWQTADDISVYAAENAPQAWVSWKGHRRAIPVNSPTFVADRHYAFDGVSSYINTGFTPSLHAGVMTG